MSGDLKYPDGIVGKILFDPIKEGANSTAANTIATASRIRFSFSKYNFIFMVSS